MEKVYNETQRDKFRLATETTDSEVEFSLKVANFL
jgi:hypothetical protein